MKFTASLCLAIAVATGALAEGTDLVIAPPQKAASPRRSDLKPGRASMKWPAIRAVRIVILARLTAPCGLAPLMAKRAPMA